MMIVRRVFAAVVISLALVGAVRADEPAGADAARAVIQSQLDAFQDEEVITAYGYAAPNVQRIFPTPDVFGSMVRDGYPMVWNPAQTEFLSAISRGEMIVQRMRIVDQARIPYVAEYAMLLVDGEWRIAGVEIKKDNSYGA